VDRLDVLDIRRGDGAVDVRIDLRCGAGTYVRSIARDAGEALGCGGYLAELRRTEAAGLRVVDAHTPATLEELAQGDRLGEVILPIADLLPLARLELDEDGATRFQHGLAQRVAADGSPHDERRAVFRAGTLLGVGRIRDGILQPEKVLAQGGA
jgi:tRNA pseudouridine55 synthase